LDEHRRESGEIGRQRADNCVVVGVVGEIGIHPAALLLGGGDRLGLTMGLVPDVRKVSPWAEQHRAAGQGELLLPDGDQQ